MTNWEGIATMALASDPYLSLSDREVLAHWFAFLQERQAEKRLPLPPDFAPCESCKANLSRRYWQAGHVPPEAVGLPASMHPFDPKFADADPDDYPRHTFRFWLRGERRRDDPIGDVARDALADPCWIDSQWTGLARHIKREHRSSSRSALRALGRAVGEYMREAATP